MYVSLRREKKKKDACFVGHCEAVGQDV